MKRIIVLPLMIAIVLLASVVFPAEKEVSADINKVKAEIEKLRRDKTTAQQRVKDAENHIVQLNSQKKRTIEEVNSLRKKIDELSMEITVKETGIDQTERELEAAEQELDDAIERVIARDDLLKTRLKLMYMRGSVSYLDVLMQSTSFADFLNRYDSVKSLVDQDKDMLEQNRKDQKLIEEKREDIETMLASLIVEYENLEAMKKTLMNQQKEREVRIAQLSNQVEEYEHVTEEQEKLLLAITSEENKKLQELNKLELQYRGGKLGYPLEKVHRVTSGYGSRIDPIDGRKGAFHSGIDVGAPKGTNIVASEAGLVILAGWYGGYGNTVIINHGKDSKGRELWTLYAHASKVVVKKGDTVKKGQKIAEVGTTGKSTGNHLHYGVYLDEQAVNPTDYVKF